MKDADACVLQLLRAQIELQREQNLLLRDLAVQLDKQKRRQPLSKVDEAQLAKLLPPAYARWNRDAFSTRDLHAAEKEATAGSTPKQTGRLFARAEGIAVDGLVVERSKKLREGVMWAVRAT